MIPKIEFLEYNFLLSLIDYFQKALDGKVVNNQSIIVIQSFSDKSNPYTSPSISIEILHRKNRSIGFQDYFGDIDNNTDIEEIEGTKLEYTVQINVYSNTRGSIHKWSSLLDNQLKIASKESIPLNIYDDNGNIIKSSERFIDFDYSKDVTNKNMEPNVMTYDFHTIYEIKMSVLQLFGEANEIIEKNNINSEVK